IILTPAPYTCHRYRLLLSENKINYMLTTAYPWSLAMRSQTASFLQYLREVKHYADNTIAAYQNDLSQFIQFADNWGAAPVDQWSDINVDLINAYIDSLCKDQYASSTITRKIATIKSLLNYLNAPGAGRSGL